MVLIYFFLGLILGDLFINIGYRLPINESIIFNRKCLKCGSLIKNNIPVVNQIINKGKCLNCHEKMFKYYYLFVSFTGLLYSLTYLINKNFDNSFMNILFSLIFISSLLITIVSDFKYMLISDEVMLISGILLVILKVYMAYYNEEILNFFDFGYYLIFLFFNFIIVYGLMYAIKKVGDVAFKKNSLGKGDVKFMAFISIVIGYKMSIVVVFLASFIALPVSIIKLIKNNDNMLPFGPFLAFSTIILFMLNINFEMILNYIS